VVVPSSWAMSATKPLLNIRNANVDSYGSGGVVMSWRNDCYGWYRYHLLKVKVSDWEELTLLRSRWRRSLLCGYRF
jgi:hypothetical protein